LTTVAGPLGDVLAQAGRDDTLSVVRLSAQALQAARLTSPLPHRRTDLY
jgi:predicted amidohydrolase